MSAPRMVAINAFAASQKSARQPNIEKGPRKALRRNCNAPSVSTACKRITDAMAVCPRYPECRSQRSMTPSQLAHEAVKTHSQQFTAAEAFEREAACLYEEQTAERLQQHQSFRSWFGRPSSLSLSRFRAAVKYAGRPAAADMAFSIAAFADGWSQNQVADALAA